MVVQYLNMNILDGGPVSKHEFMRCLGNLEHLLIRAKYHSDQLEGNLFQSLPLSSLFPVIFQSFSSHFLMPFSALFYFLSSSFQVSFQFLSSPLPVPFQFFSSHFLFPFQLFPSPFPLHSISSINPYHLNIKQRKDVKSVFSFFQVHCTLQQCSLEHKLP